MDRSSELVLAAFDQAVAMARIDLKGVEPMRGAVVLGSTLGGSLTGFRYYRAVRAGRRRPSQLRDCSMHAPGYRLCIESGFLGPNLVLSTACTSSNLALTVAHDLICANKADVVIAGGFDTMSPVSCAGFSAMRNVASGVCRPFDRRRDGLVLGEGGAVLIVEADDMAGLAPAAVDLICAHGTGTVLNDRTEARALRKVFGPRGGEIPCASIKSMLGHTLGAAGAMNAAAAIAARRGEFIPPTIHFEEPDPCDSVACSAAARPGAPRHVLSNTLGFGGANCSIVMELADDFGSADECAPHPNDHGPETGDTT